MLEVDLTKADAIVVFSDVHGNLQALEAVLDDVEAKKQRNGWKNIKYVNLGDNFGYGPNPVECLKKVKAVSDVVIRGNHEYYISELVQHPKIDPRMIFGISKNAIKGLYWTIQQIYGDNKPINDLEDAKNYVLKLLEKVKDKSCKKNLVAELRTELKDKGVKEKNLIDKVIESEEVMLLFGNFFNKLKALEQSNDLLKYVSELPIEVVLKTKKGSVYATHADIKDPLSFHYTVGQDNPEFKSLMQKKNITNSTDEVFKKWPEKLKANNIKDVLLGHVHWGGGYTNGRYFLLSVGAVGVSRFSKEPLAEYAILRPDKKGLKLNFVKVHYDHKAFVEDSRKAGLENPAEFKRVN